MRQIIIAELTPDQHKLLMDILDRFDDEGPHGESWKSDEPLALIDVLKVDDRYEFRY